MSGGVTAESLARARRAQEIFEACLDLEASAQGRWLREACGTDQHLIQEVEGLIESSRLAESAEVLIPISRPTHRTPSSNGPAPTVRPGDRLGRYLILQMIGSGGMGAVYLARDVLLERRIAIKLLAGSFGDPTAAAALIAEAS